MCIFAKSVAEVRKTRIFVSPTNDGRQLTVYENNVKPISPTEDSNDDSSVSEKVQYNAMILPCPLYDGEIVLLDLSGKNGTDFSFDKLSKCFPKLERMTKSKGRMAVSKGISKGEDFDELEIVDLGAYKVSIAPTARDIRRANKDIFKVSKGTRKVLKAEYDDGYAFVICMFDTSKEIDPHPIGYIHDRLPSGHLFVPCKHVHDGKEHKKEKFDHVIYSLDARGEEGDKTENVDELTKKYKKEDKKGQGMFIPAEVDFRKYLNKTQVGKYLSINDRSQFYRLEIVGMHDNVDLIFSVDSIPAAATKSKTKKEKKQDSEEDD